jgi:hypothetical protein
LVYRHQVDPPRLSHLAPGRGRNRHRQPHNGTAWATPGGNGGKGGEELREEVRGSGEKGPPGRLAWGGDAGVRGSFGEGGDGAVMMVPENLMGRVDEVK